MYESEIKNQKWIISPRLVIETTRNEGIGKFEAENNINIMQRGLTDDTKPELRVDCTYIKYITKYSRSSLFTLTHILVSTTKLDAKLGRYIIGIQGTMPVNGISIRNVLRKTGPDHNPFKKKE